MRFITAHKIFDGRVFLAEGSVLVLDEKNNFKELVNESQLDPGRIERLHGTITPGFVNAHCHLELSHLKGRIARHTGLPEFARQVIIQRNKFAAEEIGELQQLADREMWENGIVAVGDISNGSDSFACKAESRIHYHTFIELIGLNPANAGPVFEKGLELYKKLNEYNLVGSLAPHAPYSTSLQLIDKIAAFDSERHLPFTIHNQESPEEKKFFFGEKNNFEDLYNFLKLDISWFKAPKTTALQMYGPVLSSPLSILVHNTLTERVDVESLKQDGIFWCFCPCANLFIENLLPDFDVFKGREKNSVIGTDSLAGNTQLNLVNEINTILSRSDVFTAEDLLQALTFTGAFALGIGDAFGGFIQGKNAGLNLVDLGEKQIQFIKKII